MGTWRQGASAVHKWRPRDIARAGREQGSDQQDNRANRFEKGIRDGVGGRVMPPAEGSKVDRSVARAGRVGPGNGPRSLLRAGPNRGDGIATGRDGNVQAAVPGAWGRSDSRHLVGVTVGAATRFTRVGNIGRDGEVTVVADAQHPCHPRPPAGESGTHSVRGNQDVAGV